MPNGNTAGAERQFRAMDGAVPNRDTEGANRRDYSPKGIGGSHASKLHSGWWKDKLMGPSIVTQVHNNTTINLVYCLLYYLILHNSSLIQLRYTQ